jgi:hypothetical protein
MGNGLTFVPQPFEYPTESHVRKHGPSGYSTYDSYRAWLRDEFLFRCVYCLHREQWGFVTGLWDLDHFIPQAHDPALANEYDNLLYVCHTCNAIKNDDLVLDPCHVPLGTCVVVQADGTILGLDDSGWELIRSLRLDSPDRNRYRAMMLDTLRVLHQADRSVFNQWMGFPDDLPDLRTLRPPSNSRPAGIAGSWYVIKENGALPEVY